MQGKIKIEVISWKPLWVYWPMYLAFALTENERKDIEVELIPPNGRSTDSNIRKELTHRLDRKEFALALCEPNPVGSERDTSFTRIPLLWRQPHWMLRLRGLEHASKPSIIFCYPKDTTSGNYVRSLKTAGLLGADAEFTDMEEYRAGILADPRSAFVTFTPWHLVCPELQATDLFSGPDRDVTALIIPRDSYDGKIDPGRLKDDISRNVKSILHALVLTHGNESKIAELVSKNRTFTERFLPATAPPGAENLARSLAEYVKLGCYFPYGVVTSALYGELLHISEENFKEAGQRALAGVGQDFSRFLGTGRDWSELSFSERLWVWKTGRGEYSQLAQRISHSPDELTPILTGTAVSLSRSGLPLSLDSMNKKGRRLTCPEFQGQLCMARSWTNQGASANTHEICFACTVGGIAMSVLRMASSELAEEFKTHVPFCVCSSEQTEQVPLCWEDIEDLVRIFCNERRPFDHKTPCEVTLCHDPDNARCRFNLYWRGDTTPGNGTHSARNRMREWAKKHDEAGRKVVFVGFWKGGAPVNALDETKNYLPLRCNCESKAPFGYIAVFQYGGLTPKDVI